jgi:hypothetical protein
MTVLCFLIILPTIFRVNTTNNKVLSLFEKISFQEIEKLALDCEEYKKNFLDEKQIYQQL